MTKKEISNKIAERLGISQGLALDRPRIDVVEIEWDEDEQHGATQYS